MYAVTTFFCQARGRPEYRLLLGQDVPRGHAQKLYGAL